MNGAESLVASLVRAGVEVCFTNPGTSEMHFVAALDRQPGLRGVLGLFEGVVTGAADGYGRMAGKPASTLLHLGPGLANGLANLHNAKRASTPIVNIVGDHATDHLRYDAPLTSDIRGFASPVSDWIHTSMNARDVAADGMRAVAAACEGFNLPAALLAITQNLPLGFLVSLLFLILTTIFVATTGDSMTYVISVAMSNEDRSSTAVRVLWGLAMGAMALILVSTGSGGIGKLQSFIVVTAVPVSLILLPSLWDAVRITLAKGNGTA